MGQALACWQTLLNTPQMRKYDREPTTKELQQDVDRLLGALDAPIQTGLPGGPLGSGARTPGSLPSGARSPYDHSTFAAMRSPITGGYASGTRTPRHTSYSTPGERFSAPPRVAEPIRFHHMEAVLETLEGRSVPLPRGDDA